MIEMVKTVGQQVGKQVGRVSGGSHKGILIVQITSPTVFKRGGLICRSIAHISEMCKYLDFDF